MEMRGRFFKKVYNSAVWPGRQLPLGKLLYVYDEDDDFCYAWEVVGYGKVPEGFKINKELMRDCWKPCRNPYKR